MATWKRPRRPREGLAKAIRSDRDNDEGTVAIAVGNTAAIVQIKTETDFSAKNNAVTTLAQTLADAILTGGPARSTPTLMPSMISRSIKENIELGAVEQIVAADGNILDTYLHSQDGNGVNAVVEGNGVSQEDLHQVALRRLRQAHYLSSDEIPADDIEERLATRDHQGRGQARAGLGQDRHGPTQRLEGERALLEQVFMATRPP